MGIISVDELGAYVGKSLSDDRRAAGIVLAVESWIEAYTGRVFGRVDEVAETHDLAPVVFLDKLDIVKLVSVKVHGLPIEVSAMTLNKKTGRVVLGKAVRAYGAASYDAVEVVYRAGLAEVPAEVKQAALQLAAHNYNLNDAENGGILSESVGGYSISYADPERAQGGSGAVSRHSFMGVFDSWRVRSF